MTTSMVSPLLELPIELQQAIIKDLIDWNKQYRGGPWPSLTENPLLGLSLTCHKLHNVIQKYHTQSLVPFDYFKPFAIKLYENLKSRATIFGKYRSLTIQFRHNASTFYLRRLAAVLDDLAPVLEELHLSFTGHDKYGREIYIHGCGEALNTIQEEQLPIEAQKHYEKAAILYAIQKMVNLKILVISNFNSQLYQGLFNHKPKLQYVHLTADSRSAVHTNDVSHVGMMARPVRYPYPPVKVMHIDANSTLMAMNVPSFCALTLEHLSITIPDAKLGSNKIKMNLFAHFGQLINNLVLNKGKLTTLRVCVQGDGVKHNSRQYGDMTWALTGGLRRLDTLRNLEIHMKTRLEYFGNDFLAGHSPLLERLYVSSTTVHPNELDNFLTEKYFSATNAPAVLLPRVNQEVQRQIQDWQPQPPGNDSGNDVDGLYLDGIIGEDHRRKDYIPVRGGNLQFISYKFTGPDDVCRTGESLTQMSLRWNSRLIDRARNKHLANLQPGAFIPTRKIVAIDKKAETYSWSANIEFAVMLYMHVYSAEVYNPRNKKELEAELANSPFTDDTRYFGTEEEAHEIFENEKVAKIEDLLPLTTPYCIDCESGEDCHWMCPDVDVPTLAQLR